MQRKNKFCTQMLAWMLTLSMILSLALPAASMNVQAETVSGPNLEETDNTVSGPNVTEKDNIISTAELNDESPILLNEPAELLVKLNFNNENAGDTPSGWALDHTCEACATGACSFSMSIVEDGDNKVAKISQTTKTNTTTHYMKYLFEETDKAILEYQFKADDRSHLTLLPILAYQTDSKVSAPLYLKMDNVDGRNKKIFYCADNKSWAVAKEGLVKDVWHTIKIVVDLKENTRELYINNEKISLTGGKISDIGCDTENKINSVATGIWYNADRSFYIDNIKVSEYVAPEQDSRPEIPFVQDFETEETGSTLAGWNGKPQAEEIPSYTMEVKTDTADAAKHVAEFNRTAVGGGTVENYMTYEFQDVRKATLEYRFKTSSNTNNVWLPILTYNTLETGITAPLYLKAANNGTKVSYSYDNYNWTLVSTIKADTWNTIKIQIDLNENIRELYVNGQRVSLANTTKPTDKQTLCGVAAGIFRNATNANYQIDDISVSDYKSTNAVVTPSVPFTRDFEGEEAVKEFDGWNYNAARDETCDFKIEMVEEDGKASNHVMKISQVGKTDNKNAKNYADYLFKTEDKAVLEYRFKTDINSNQVFLPVLMYNDGSNSNGPLYLNLTNGGTRFRYSYNNSTWIDAANGLEPGTWHSLKMVVDISEKNRELYLDGNQIILGKTDVAWKDKLSGITTGIFRGQDNSVCYFDDISVTEYVPGESVSFEETHTIPVLGTVELTPSFTPEDTSIRGMVYTSSDESIATVDAYGVVTGLKAGTATITATPTLKNLAKQTITITVSGSLAGTITVEPEEVELPVGGHQFLNATLTWDNNAESDTSLLFASSNPTVATVDEWGEILAISEGEATITICSSILPDENKEVKVTVKKAKVVKQIYVSPDGSATGTGEANDKVTLAEALKIVNANNDDMNGNIEVILSGGYYHQSTTLHLTENHGGDEKYSVIYKAAEGETPVIGGAIFVSGSDFTETAEGSGIYVANVAPGTKTRELYVNNVRATRARSNTSFENADFLYDSDGKNIGIICDDATLKVAKPDEMELVYHTNWIHARAGVKSVQVDGENVKLTMDNPCWKNSQDTRVRDSLKISAFDYFENALEFLDEPGEWYLDSTAGKLYYMPRTWENMSTIKVTIPTLDAWDESGADEKGLLTVVGSSYDSMVQNIRFEGITFADSTYMRPSSDYGHHVTQNNHIVDGQAADYSKNVDSAVTVKRANGVSFVDCDFTRIGGIALKFTGGVQNSMIEGNHFYDISSNAIQIGEPNYQYSDNYNPREVSKLLKNCDVTNNYIHDIGVDYKSSAAIGVSFAADMDMTHNEIFNIPYCGFHIGYGWGVPFDCVLKNLNVSHNFIHDLMHDGIYDGGGVYTLGNTAGNNVISDNYIRNQGNYGAMIYFDQGSSFYTAKNNVLDSSETPYETVTGKKLWWFNANNFANNILAESNYATSDTANVSSNSTFEISFKYNVQNADANNWPEEAKDIINASGLESDYTELRNAQAERITTNLPEEDFIGLKAGETFDIKVALSDGKDNTVSMSNTKVYYATTDKTIAEVDANGKIIAKASGQTKVRVYVISNDILDMFEKDVYVDDIVKEIKLEGANDIALYDVVGTKVLVKPYGVSKDGRKLTLSDISYEVEDENVAVADADGYMKPVSVGSTTVKITGTVEGQTISGTFNVVVNPVGELSYLDDIFAKENVEKWVGANASNWELVDDTSITTTVDGHKIYSGKKYENEMLTFYMGIERSGNWPSFYLRAQDTSSGVALGNTGYIVLFHRAGMQLQRFNGSDRTDRTVIYGTVDGFESKVGPNVTPCPLDDGKLHKIQATALNEGDGVRLLMFIDGELIFDYLDTDQNAVKEAGYFGIYGTKANDVPDTITLVKALATEDLEEAVQDAENVSEYEYTEESVKVFKEALESAQALLNATPGTVTQAQINQALETLAAAQNALVKRPFEIVDAATDDTYQKGSNDPAVIYCTGALNEFVSVEMDEKVVDSANYTLKEGSTILTFKPEYLDTLSVGKHTVKLNYTGNRSVSTVLEILAKTGNDNTGGSGTGNAGQSGSGSSSGKNESKPEYIETIKSPEKQTATGKVAGTGDASNIGMWIILMIGAAAATGLIVYKKKKKA